MQIRKISDKVSAATQVSAQNVAEIKAAGFAAIINNRPDGGEVNQPWHDDIEEEAQRLGIDYHYVPVITAPYAPKMVARMGEILSRYQEPVLIFCRTGTRSTNLWAISQKGKVPGAELIAQAAQAGYDISHLADELI